MILEHDLTEDWNVAMSQQVGMFWARRSKSID